MKMKFVKHEQQASGTKSSAGTAYGGIVAFLLIGTVFWATWNESVAWSTLLTGLALSALSLSLTSRYLLKAPYETVYRIPVLTALHYIWVLVVAIFESGIHAIYITITGRIQVHIVDLPTDVETPFYGVLIANAITLTPGTVTVDHHQGFYKVIWIETVTDDIQEASEMIKGRFERVFLPGKSKRGARA